MGFFLGQTGARNSFCEKRRTTGGIRLLLLYVHGRKLLYGDFPFISYLPARAFEEGGVALDFCFCDSHILRPRRTSPTKKVIFLRLSSIGRLQLITPLKRLLTLIRLLGLHSRFRDKLLKF